MSAANQIRSPQSAGSGIGEPNPAANSSVEGARATVAPGGATGDTLTHIQPIAGGELHVMQAGRLVGVQIRTGRGLRNRLTASMTPDAALLWFQRGLEIAQHARARRQAKGA